jgi:hypothetical protein
MGLAESHQQALDFFLFRLVSYTGPILSNFYGGRASGLTFWNYDSACS